jgi:hypothetical protein
MQPQTEPFGRLRVLRKFYTGLAVTLLNCAVFFLILNLFLALALPHRSQNPITKYGLDKVLKLYPGWKEADVRELLNETWEGTGTFEHHPFAQFKNGPFHGKYITVIEPGFRVVKEQAPWPPSPARTNIFFFGGSTAFGLGVTTEQTAASYLQTLAQQTPRNKPVAVYNFGVPSYFNSQEVAYLFDLLAKGIVPDAAVFLDGLNDLSHVDTPSLTHQIDRFLRGQAWRDFLYQKFPVVRVTYDSLDRMRAHGAPASLGAGKQQAQRQADAAISRWCHEKRMLDSVATTFGFPVVLAWQPIPQYHYDLHSHALCGDRGDACFDDLELYRYGYGRMESLYQRGNLGADFLWLADMQINRNQNFYIDSVHYTPGFNQEIASRIYAALLPALGKSTAPGSR